jgi:L-fuconolactonase
MKPRVRDGGLSEWAAGITKIAQETSVFCKLSALATEAQSGWKTETLLPYARHVIEVFGAKRTMFGSDWPVLELNGSYDSWFQTAKEIVQPSDFNTIFGETAAEFYRIHK